MAFEFGFLQDTPIADITEAYNSVFSDYFIEVQMTEEQMAYKLKAEDIDLSISIGCRENGRLQGLMLHGRRLIEGEWVAYNAGTGVRPTHRRLGLVFAMYQHLLPHLRAKGFHKSVLEVIDINAPAIAAYEKVGFKKTRLLEAYRGHAPARELPEGYQFIYLDTLPDLALLRSMWMYSPTWQHQFNTYLNTSDRHKVLTIQQAEKICGYSIFTPFSGRVLQFAIRPDQRGKGLGAALFSEMQRNTDSQLYCVNVTQMEHGPGDFLYHLGLRKFVCQYEMELLLAE